jgi:hypothetical protein
MATENESPTSLTVLDTDTPFNISPEAGDPLCVCSRCEAPIQEHECPLRVLTTNEKGECDKNSQEYRYCESCMTKMGMTLAPDDYDSFYPDHEL